MSYRWEQGMTKTWETVQEDEHGNIITSDESQARAKRAKLNRITASIRRGLIRSMVIVLDCSSSSLDNDMRPSRLENCKAAAIKFIREYFDQNPISQLAVVVTRDRTAQTLSEMSSNPKQHINQINRITAAYAIGLSSLQNSLLLCNQLLVHMPGYATREVIILYTSLSTCDPGNIFDTIMDINKRKIRCNVICTTAEVHICRKLTELTSGMFSVSLNSRHLDELLQYHSIPPAEYAQAAQEQGGTSSSSQASLTSTAASGTASSYIFMGFPTRVVSNGHFICFNMNTTSTAFSSGVSNDAADAGGACFSNVGYTCPRCLVRVTDIPSQCSVCGLLLNSSAHIARSHHHLYPLDNFVDTSASAEEVSRPGGASVETTANATETGAMDLAEQDKGGQLKPVAVKLEPDSGDAEKDKKQEISYCKGCLQPFCYLDTSPRPPVQRYSKANSIYNVNTVSYGKLTSKKAKEKRAAAEAAAAAALASESVGPVLVGHSSMQTRMQCKTCKGLYCIDCDIFIHDNLHNCPGDV